MIKKLTSIMILLFIASSMNIAQWANLGPFPDDTYKGGTHGIAVDPDGKIWQASYYKEAWVTPGGDTLQSTPIYVFNADGTFNQVIGLVTSGSTIDTLKGNCRGLGVDENGNILYVQSGPSKVIKINSTTFEGMGSRVIADDIGSSPTAPSVADNGTIFIGPVVGGGTTAIAMYDTDLNYLGNAVVGPPAISRTLIVSKDGNKIYWMPFTAAKTYVYSRADEFSAYELADSMFIGMSIETTAWQPGTGHLWVSNDKRGTDSSKSDLTWYGYDLTTSAFVDSFSLAPTGGSDEWPRGLAFNPDGSIAYVGLFGTAYDRIYKFTNNIPDSISIAVTYEVDMELEILKGNFTPGADTVEVRGAYFGWGSEAPDMEQSAVNPNIYTHTENQMATIGDNLPAYKFYYTPGNWEGGDNKTYKISQADYDNGFAVVTRSFNDASLASVLNQDCTILFTVDTDSSISSINNAMFTTVNTVHITGAVTPLKWPDGGWPDAQIDRMIPLFDDGTNGDVTANDKIFSRNVTFPKYTSFRIQYKYGINFGDAANNQGGNDNENGVGADHFIDLTADLSAAKVENKFGKMGTHALVDMVTGVEVLTQLPTGFELTQNYPNPFNPTTKINFQIPNAQNVSLKVYNLLGQEVATLINGQMGAGVYEVGFDASQLSSGVYIYSIKAGSFTASRKMTLVK